LEAEEASISEEMNFYTVVRGKIRAEASNQCGKQE
jgi:hypothetical protein